MGILFSELFKSVTLLQGSLILLLAFIVKKQELISQN